MRKRLFTAGSVMCAIALGLAFLSAPAAAQDQGYYTYVSLWGVPRSQWAAFDKQEEATAATMQRLVADGTVVAWSNQAARVHQEDGYTHSDAFIASSRAGLMKALETLYATAANPAFAAVTKHHDLLLHTFAHGGKTSSGATGYLRVTLWQAKAGQEDALEAHLLKYIKPRLDDDVENGMILMYNLDKEDVHTVQPGAYDLAIIFPNGEAIDKFFAELAAAQKENPTVAQVLNSLTVGEAHRDTFWRVTAYQHK
jgi:hypothetical protein